MQWLVNALVTDDDKKGGGGDIPEAHSFEKKATFRYRIAIGFSLKNCSRHWLAIRGGKF